MTPEDRLQASMVQWLDLVAPGLIYLHIPNGGSRNAWEARKLKAMGVRAGAPDLEFLLPDGRVLWVEVKVPGGRMQDSQTALHPRMADVGHQVHIARSIDDLRAILVAAGVATRERVEPA